MQRENVVHLSRATDEADRKSVLLRAVHDILQQQRSSSKVLNCLALTTTYDGAPHDGDSLLDAIASELNI